MGFVPSLLKMQLFGGKRLHVFLSESRVSQSWDLYCLVPSFPSCQPQLLSFTFYTPPPEFPPPLSLPPPLNTIKRRTKLIETTSIGRSGGYSSPLIIIYTERTGDEEIWSRLIKIQPIPTIYTLTSIPFFLHSHYLPALQRRLAREEDGRFFPRMSRRGV